MFSISVFRWRHLGTLRFRVLFLMVMGTGAECHGEMVQNKTNISKPTASAIRGKCHEESSSIAPPPPQQPAALTRSQQSPVCKHVYKTEKQNAHRFSFFALGLLPTQLLIQAKPLFQTPLLPASPAGLKRGLPTPPPGKGAKLEDICIFQSQCFQYLFSGGAHLAH